MRGLARKQALAIAVIADPSMPARIRPPAKASVHSMYKPKRRANTPAKLKRQVLKHAMGLSGWAAAGGGPNGSVLAPAQVAAGGAREALAGDRV